MKVVVELTISEEAQVGAPCPYSCWKEEEARSRLGVSSSRRLPDDEM